MRQQGHRRPPRAAVHRGAAAAPDWRRELRDAIVSRVVPRLAEPAGPEKGEGDVDRFAALALAGSVGRLAEDVEARRSGGAAADALMLDLLAPAARRLGDLWLADRVGFLDVTAGLGRLQAVARTLGPALDEGVPRGADGRKVLLAPAPGEQHVFGLSIVAAFFRRAGWEVSFEPRIALDDLLRLVAAERFAAVGLSAAGDRFVDPLPEQIAALRRASRNAELAVMVGGPAFLADPGLGGRVGADAAPRDARDAVHAAERLAARAVA